MKSYCFFAIVVFCTVFCVASISAQERTLDDYFPFEPPQSREKWEQRRLELRRQILLSQGLWPLPDKTDLKPIVHHSIEREEYTVHGVILEVVPDYYLTGNLYVPKKRTGKVPGVLSPHGHWADGRFYEQSLEAFSKELEVGAEKYDPSGRFPLQARCATLARLGCVVFHYDMIGYADSVQVSHRPGVRESMNTKDDWGFFSPQAELRLQSMMGLQTLGSIRALDWLETLPEVDPARIAITGASGGGTQSFVLSAIDDRIAVSFPAVMVSTAMQGGCTCENANYLRVGTGNVEIAAMFAPKPLGMTAADDWTVEMETKGFPQLQQLYGLYDAGKNVSLFPHLQFGHNYNFVSRDDMYRFMNEHLKLGHEFQTGDGDCRDATIEQPFEPLTVEELTVWTGDHTKPSGDRVGDTFERKLLREMDRRSQTQMNDLAKSPQKFREIVGGALETMIGWEEPSPDDLALEGVTTAEKPFGTEMKGRFVDKRSGITVSGVFLIPTNGRDDELCIFVSKNGVADFLDEQERPTGEIEKCLAAGKSVAILDLYGQGDNTIDGHPLEKAARIGYGDAEVPWQRYLAYTYGYNPTIFSRRVQNLLTIIDYTTKIMKPRELTLYGLKGGAPYAAAARALVGDAVDEMVVDTEGFRFANLETLDDVNMLPGIVKYGDLPALLKLSDPKTTEIRGE